jgi:2-dehydro-3-deoxy-D-gluconate 5-dehydrogenase
VTDTQKQIEALGRKVSVYTADLSSPEDVRAVVPKVLADGHQIRILINCAGIQIRHPCDQFPDDDFNKVRQTPLRREAALAGLLDTLRVG